MSDLLTPAEAAAELRVGVSTIHRMIAAGKLAFIEVGTGTLRPRRRIRRDTLDRFKRAETIEHASARVASPAWGRWA